MLLGRPAFFQAEAAVMGAEAIGGRRDAAVGVDLFRRCHALVEPTGQLLDGPAVVGEDDCRAMPVNQADDSLFNCRPDGSRWTQKSAPVGTWPDDLQIHGLAPAGVDDRHRPGFEPAVAPSRLDASLATQIARHLFERPLSRRQADPDERGLGNRFETFQEQGQEDAALVAADGVNLIDDDVGNAAQDLAGPAGQHQVK